MSDATEEDIASIYDDPPTPPDRLRFFRQQFFPTAVFAMMINHKDGWAWGLLNLAIVVVMVFIVSIALSYWRKP